MTMPRPLPSTSMLVGAPYAARSSPWASPVGRPSIFPPRRLQRAPKRPVAIAPRRHLAASGPMPPALACKFTVSELAVLRIIGDEVRRHGCCDRCVDELAARAGVCRRMVQNAIREAARLGLLTVEERRREGRRNLPNVVRIVSKEWTSWLARGGRSSSPAAEPLIGCKKMRPTDKDYKTQRSRASEAVFAARGQQAGSAVPPYTGQRDGRGLNDPAHHPPATGRGCHQRASVLRLDDRARPVWACHAGAALGPDRNTRAGATRRASQRD